MPEPKDGETRDDYIGRCVPIVLHEGTTENPKQAAAICISMWEKNQEGKSASWVTVDEMRELCPSCADQMVKRGLSRVNINALDLELGIKARGNIEGLATHLAHAYGDDPGYWTKCDQSEELADYDEDTRAAICARAHYIWVGKWPGEKSAKQLSLDERVQKIRGALERWMNPHEPMGKIPEAYYWVEFVYDNYAILNTSGKRYRVDFQVSEDGEVVSIGQLIEVKPEWQPVKGFWYAGSSDGDALKLGARNNRADRERVRKIRKAAKEIHDTTMEMESRDADDETDEPEMMESVAQLMGSMGGKNMLVSIGGAVKALGESKDGQFPVGGYLVTFGDESTPDLSKEKDYFDKDTDFRLAFPSKSAGYFNHTIPVTTSDGKEIGVSRPLKASVELTLDDLGVFAKAILDERDEYEALLADLTRKGIISWSSGTAEHLVRRTPKKNGVHHIDFWPLGLDASLTHAPADWRNQVLPLKSILDSGVLQLHAEQAEQPAGATEAVRETASSDGKAGEAAKSITPPITGDSKMEMTPELQNLLAETAKTAAEQAAKLAASEAVKALTANEKPINDPGTLLPGSIKGIAGNGIPADQPYGAFKGGFGKFLSDVALAARPGVAPDGRLIAIQSAGVKALGANEAIPSEGGWLVQTDHAAALYKLVFDSGVFSSRCNRKQISGNANAMTMNALDESSRATGSRFGGVRGYRIAEGGTISTSKPTFRKMELKLKKFAAACYATDELLADTGLLEQVIMEAAPQELSFMVDDDILNGLGAAGPQGILNSNALISVAAETGQAATTIVFENIVKMWSRLWARSASNAVWFINQDVTPQLFAMSLSVGTGGVPVFMPPGGISGNPYGTIFNRPVIATEFNATLGTVGDIVLADLSQYQLIDKGGVESASSMHVQFLTDEMVYRFIYRVDGQPLWSTALTPYKGTGNTQSPYIALATRS